MRQEVRAKPDGAIEGYALVYDSPSDDLGGFIETISRGAVQLTDDVLATFDHDPGKLLGRSSSGSLTLADDATGLRYTIAPPVTQVGRDLVEQVRRGDVQGASFSFRTLDDEWRAQGDGEPDLRILRSIVVSELGPVVLPAYSATSVSIRTMGRCPGESDNLQFYRATARLERKAKEFDR